MKKVVLIVMVVLILALVFGYRTVRNVLVDSINKRLDSSEAIILNEVDSRLYRDFHSPTSPTQIETSSGSLQYNINGETVVVANDGNNISLTIQYSDGTEWSGGFTGQIEVQEVDSLRIGEDIKVQLKDTTSRVFAINYKFYEDIQKKRVTLNRQFTRYLSVTTE